MGEECFIRHKNPVNRGGGISTLEDIDLVLEAGADKISMNSAAVKNRIWSPRAPRNLEKTK